jgi:hypothetical protein
MATPVGMWNVVTNLNNAVLNITSVDAQGNLTGTYQPDGTDTFNISGTWNAATSELKFSYNDVISIKWARLFFFASFDGYLFQAGQPLFNASPGSVSNPVWNMISGTYSVGPFFEGFAHPTYGWVARSQEQI